MNKKNEKKDIVISDVYSKLKDEKFIDTHVHLEYILQKKKIQMSTLEKQIESQWYDGCLCVFCDPMGISEGFGMYEEILKNDKSLKKKKKIFFKKFLKFLVLSDFIHIMQNIIMMI